MRIAMFMPGLGPDALGWKVHLDFAAAVEGLGHRFELLTTPRPGEPGEENSAAPADDDESSHRVTVLQEPASAAAWARLARPILRTRHLLPAAGALAHHLKTRGEGIDLLHLEVAYPHAAAGVLAAGRSGWRGRIAVTPMGEDILVVRRRSYGMRRYPVPSMLVNRTLRRADAIRCISPLAERQIVELAPYTTRRVIPLNISAEIAAAAGADGARREALRRDARSRIDDDFDTAGRPLVLSFGRLHPFKGIDVLIDAATAIGDATVLIVGPSLTVRPIGDVAASLQRRAERLGVTDKVRIVGGVHPSRALDVLAAADVVVVPSPLESLNKVCMEAAAVGTPFVVTETTGVSAWVPDTGVGIVVPPNNSATLAWAIDEIIGGHFAYDAAAAAAFARRFTPQRIAGEVMELYEEVTG